MEGKIAMQTLEEISNSIVQLQNDLKAIITTKETVELEESDLARQILTLRIQQKHLQDAILKAGNNVKRLKIDISQMTEQYWTIKNG